MWTISGPFDVEITGISQVSSSRPQEAKLLKSGKKYLLGRKDCDLVVNSKKVSRDHGQIIVGGYTIDDVANPDKASSLELFNTKSRTMSVIRAGERMTVNPGSALELQEDDKIDVVTGIPLTVKWLRVCCYESPSKVKGPVSTDGCASLGINVVRSLHPAITHHLAPTFTLSPLLSTSLLTASQFVKPQWLEEILRLGLLPPNDPKSLEWTFALPPESKHRPGFSASLHPDLKKFKTWEPNEERLNMFRGCRFVFVGEKGREVSSEYRTLVERGQGECELFTVDAGLVKWKRTLDKAKAWAKEKKGMVSLVADDKAMETAVGRDGWRELVDGAKEVHSAGLRFILPENILQAVAHVDKYYIDCDGLHPDHQGPSPLPDFVPNTHPEEPSIPPDFGLDHQSSNKREAGAEASSSRLPPSEKSTPRTESEEPSEPAAPGPLRRPRKLTRRTQQTSLALLGLDEDSSMMNTTSAKIPAKTVTPVVPELVPPPPTQSRFRSRTKNVARLLGLDDALEEETHRGPSLDKYKALFDASDPDRLAQTAATQGITQTDTQAQSRSDGLVVPLPVVREEDEETSGMQTQARGSKRKADELDDDVVMREIEDDPDADQDVELDTNTDTGAPHKRRALENVHAIVPASQAPPPSSQAKGAPLPPPPTKFTKPPSSTMQQHNKSKKKGSADTDTDAAEMDTDERFLKAVNSTKRGKKHEDEFDREFNNLRISKPELDRDQREQGWAVLEDFGNENVRGNFMVVVDVDVDTTRPSRRGVNVRAGGKPEWVGRPDFKKFKKKTSGEKRDAVALVVSDENDYGVGPAYWKPRTLSESNSGSQTLFGSGIGEKTQTQARASRKGKSRAMVINDSDEDEEEVKKGDVKPARAARDKPPSTTKKAPSTAKPSSKASASSRTSSKTNVKPAPTGRVTRSTRSQSQPLFLESDDDEIPGKRLDDIGEENDVELGDGLEVEVGGWDDDGEEDMDGTSATMRTDRTSETQQSVLKSTRRTTAQKRKASIVGDDSDDGVFKGFKSRKKGRTG
ncbi:hypothetical protein EW146_g2373 [Bondarzewia mesenterica]|uniref:Nibrin second BRCT domain-containing protein n=1 Tax=Bondarzewia mesenterica TaxID=1095465 RepID=A0A4S4M0U2_9AGAM|nr:hypothetical protein EW146_g2373 [Bondarzewia mesenterica]